MAKQKKQKKVRFEDFEPKSYEEIMAGIEKKLGKRPVLPKSLPSGDWTDQAKQVLEERYLIKDKEGKVIETPDEMSWRVSWDVASAEATWGATKDQVKKRAKEFYKMLSSRKFLPNSPTLMNAGTGNGMQYSGCYVLPVGDSLEDIFDAIKYQ